MWWTTALVAAGLQACATGEPAPAPPREAEAPASLPAVVRSPNWRQGDQWSYRWTSGKESGTKTMEVVATPEIRSVPYYVVRVGGLEHLYTHDLHWAGSLLGDRVEARIWPPHPWFSWPLEVGHHWSQHGTYEEQGGKRQYDDSFAVVSVEVIEVPAGRFESFKIVRQSSDGDQDEYWYSPEVRFYVRWVGRRGGAQFEERLQSYRVNQASNHPLGSVPPPLRPR